MADEATIKKKKLPFKPTALLRKARAAKAAEDGGAAADKKNYDDLFYRGKEMEKILAADLERSILKKKRQEEERKRKIEEQEEKERMWEKMAEEKVKASTPAKKAIVPVLDEDNETEVLSSFERSRTIQSDSFGDDGPVSPPPSKRSRTSLASPSGPVHSPTNNPDDGEEGFVSHSPSQRLDGHRNTRSRDARATGTPSRTNAEPANAVVLDSDSEPELLTDIKGKGKAVTREKSVSPPPPEVNKYQRFIDEAEARRKDQAKAGKSNIFLQVLVNSTIPGSQPLTFKLRIDQPLRVMLNHWAAGQRKSGHPDFPIHSQEETDQLIITFNKARVFPDSSLQILGIRADSEGNILHDGHSAHDRDALCTNGRGVILEVWTLASFKQMEVDEELRRKRDMGELSDEEEEMTEVVEESQPVKVRLVAKGMEMVRASVKPEYSVETLVSVFRKSRGVGSETEVTLYFDGEKLEEHMTIQDADIQDMDTIEVYLK